MNTVQTLQNCKTRKERITVLTAYDASFSRLLNLANVDVILVGDTLGHVIQGHSTTLPVQTDDICYHIRNVARGNHTALLIGDMPFVTYHTPEIAMENAGKIMQAGAHMVKLEGGRLLEATVRQLTAFGIPVCAHLGLLPQSVHQYGGYRKQGRTEDAAKRIVDDALCLQAAGASLVVLECIPAAVAKTVTEALTVPTIGIGAGPDTDGQVLVSYDIIGLSEYSMPPFAKAFVETFGKGTPLETFKAFVSAVKSGDFPRE